jgi:hypothetical protein
MSGAVDLSECPGRGRGRTRVGSIGPLWCMCGQCAICGYHKHTGIHGPLHGQPPGSRPFGHEFVATVNTRKDV